MNAVFVIAALIAGISLAALLIVCTNWQFDRKLERIAEENRLRTLELARQGKCPYPPPQEHNPFVKGRW